MLGGSAISFRKPLVVVRSPPGMFVNAQWVVPGSTTTLTILANVQPAHVADYDRMVNETGGERVGRMIRIYTGAKLIVEDPRQNSGGRSPIADQVIYQSPPGSGTGLYKVIAVSTWNAGFSIDHYRYLAVEVPAP